MSQLLYRLRKEVKHYMTDDKKRQPFQDDTAAQDQQKGGEATATDQDVADMGEEAELPTDTSDMEEESGTEDTTTSKDEEEHQN